MALTRPPTWGEVEQDERFKALTPDLKLQALNNWSKLSREYGTSTGLFYSPDEQNKYLNTLDVKTREYESLIPKNVGTLEGITNAAANAWDSSQQALKAVGGVSPEEAAEISKIEYDKQARSLAPGYRDYLDAQGLDAVKAFAVNPIEVTTNIVAEGLAGSVPALAAGLATGLAGAAIGAPTVVGAPIGFMAGQVTGTFAGSLATEYGGKILQELQEAGMDMTNPDSIIEFFSNEELVNAAREKGLKRGIPIAIFDAFSAGIGGRVSSIVKAATKAPVGSVARNVAESGAVQALTKTPTRLVATELGIQAGAGGLGEVAGSLVAGDPIEGKSVFAEILGEAGPAIAEIATGRVSSGFNAKKAEAKAARDKKVSETLKTEQTLQENNAPLTAKALRDATVGSLKEDTDRVETIVSDIEEREQTAAAEAAYREQRPPIILPPATPAVVTPTPAPAELERIKPAEEQVFSTIEEANRWFRSFNPEEISSTGTTTQNGRVVARVSFIPKSSTTAPTPAVVTPTPAPAAVTPAPAVVTPAPVPTPVAVAPVPTPAVVTPTPAVVTPTPVPTPAPAAVTPTPAPAAPTAQRPELAEAIKRRNVNEDGTIWLDGNRVAATPENVERVLSSQTRTADSENLQRSIARLEQLAKEMPDADIETVRRMGYQEKLSGLEADTRLGSFVEALKEAKYRLQQSQQYAADLRLASAMATEAVAPAPTPAPAPATAPAPVVETPAPAPAPVVETTAPELQAPNPDAQAYEDELVQESLNAGTKVPQRTVEQIRKDIKGTGRYPGQYQVEIRKLRERVKARLAAATPTPTPTAPAAVAAPTALPTEQETLIEESLQKGGVPSTAAIKSRFKEAGVEQQRAVRTEGVRRLASNYGIEYSDTLDMVKDFDKKDSLPVRLVPSAEEGVSTVEPVFVNNPDVAARQLDKGYTLTVPENMRNNVAPGITFDPNTGQVTSAQSRGFTVQKLGELAKQVRDSRVKVEGSADINSEADMKKLRVGVQKLSKNKDFETQLRGVITRLAEFNTNLPISDKSILETKALSIWVDGQLKNKPIDPALAWKFAERKLAPKLAVRVQEESLQAAYTESGQTLENVLSSEEPTQEQLDAEAEQLVEVAAAAAETGEVYKPEAETGTVVATSRASRISYDQAKNLVSNPRPPANLDKAAKAQFAQFLQEAGDLIEFTKDIRAQLLKDGVSAKDYGNWTYDDFANVDVGNTGVVLESSAREDSPYIREQIGWFDNIANQLGVPDIGFFTPEQFSTISRYYADKYRPYFDAGNTTLPADSSVADLENIQKIFETGVGTASAYRTTLQELQGNYPGIRRIIYSTKKLANAWYDPKYPGVVFFNPVQLEREVAGLTESEAFPVLRAIMDEEYDHYVTVGVISPEQAADIVGGLDELVLQNVIDEYLPADQFQTTEDRQAAIDELMANPSSVGYEYLRMIRQRMKRGLTTEDLTNNIPQSIKDKIFQMIRALIAKMRTRLLVYRDPVLARATQAVERGYRVMEIREEINNLSPEDRDFLYENPILYKELFAKPKQGTIESKQILINNAAEAEKIKPGKSYWILPSGQVIDVVGVDFSNANPTHGRYVRQWVRGNLRNQSESIENKEIARKIEDRARDLMAQDIGFLEYDETALEEEYQEAVAVQEALGDEPPDRDQFMRDAYNSAGPTDAAYNLAAISQGWARVAVPRQMDQDRPLTIQVSKNKLGKGANVTIGELTQLRPTYVTDESTSVVGDYLGAKVAGYLGETVEGVPAVMVPKRDAFSFLQYLRSMPNQAPFLPSAPGKRTKGTRASDKVFIKGGIWSSGLFTPKQRDIILAGKSEVAAANNEFKFALEALDRSVKKAYGKTPPVDVINSVLGSTENPLTDAQVQDIKDYTKTLRARKLEADEISELVGIRKAAFRNVNQNAQRAKIAADLATLDPKVAQSITAMRQKLDLLSTKLIEGGYIAQELIPVFEGNMELYLHRNYAIYNDPIWKEYMTNPQTAEHMKIRTAFEKLATDRAVAEKVAELRRESRKVDPTKVMSIADAKTEVKNNYTDWVARRVDEITTDFLDVADQDSYKFFVGGSSLPGKRSLDILKVRGQLPKEVRDFWGEEKDIKLNFVQAAGKMASFISATDTARNILENGISEGFIWKRNYDNRVVFNGKTRKYDVILGDVRKEGFNTEKEAEAWRQTEYPAAAPKLAASVHPKGFVRLLKKGANPQSVAPLDGAYGPPELRDALNQAFNPKATAGWANWFSALSLVAMSAKTVGYLPRSAIRNFLGNPLIILSKGLFNLSDPMSMVKSMADGFKVAGLNLGLRSGKLLNVQPLLQKLIRLGVVNDTFNGGLLKQLYEDSNEIPILKALFSDTPYDSKLKNLGVGVAKKIGKVYSIATDIYTGVDDIWKVYAWQQERIKQANANPSLSESELDEAAAYNVRNTVPTYSLSPEITKEIRRIPILAPFITWTSEVLRTTSNGIAIANAEIKEGIATKNKALYANGISRWAGLISALGIIPAASAVSNAVFNNGEEDDEAVRELLPDWQKNAQIVLLGKPEGGKVRYLDLSYLDPFQVFKEPIIAAIRGLSSGDDLLKVVSDTGSEALRPLFSEQLFFGAVLDAMRNRTADGFQITNPQNTVAKQTYDKVKHVAASLTPGVLASTIPNIIRGAKGEISRNGQVYSLSNELYSTAFGQKIGEMDAQTKLRGRVSSYKRDNADSSSLFNDVFLNRGTVEPGEVAAAFERASKAKEEIYNELRDAYESALKLGVSKKEAYLILTGQGTGEGLSKDLAISIVRGRYVPYRPNVTTLKRAVATRPNGRERVDELRKYLAEKPRD